MRLLPRRPAASTSYDIPPVASVLAETPGENLRSLTVSDLPALLLIAIRDSQTSAERRAELARTFWEQGKDLKLRAEAMIAWYVAGAEVARLVVNAPGAQEKDVLMARWRLAEFAARAGLPLETKVALTEVIAATKGPISDRTLQQIGEWRVTHPEVVATLVEALQSVGSSAALSTIEKLHSDVNPIVTRRAHV